MSGRPSPGHRLEHRLLAALLGALRLLPEGASGRTGEALGMLWYLLDRRRRLLAVRNIAAARGPWSSRPAPLARESFRHLGRTLAEFARLPLMAPADFRRLVRFENLEVLDGVLARGRGALLVTAHLGNWELMAAAYAALGRPLWVVAKTMSNHLSERLINGLRTSSGLRVIPHRGAARRVLRALEAGEPVGILMDQSALRREAVVVDFLGRPAATSFLPAALAARAGAPVLPVWTVREGPGRHVVRFGREIPLAAGGDPRGDARENTIRFTLAVESMVSSRPGQWFWVHDRWKVRRGMAGGG